MMHDATTTPLAEPLTDAQWVASSLGGDREAFGAIVARHQRLLCSIAYAATGSLSESEDLAQEAFLEAWQKLGTLREPEKLRPWLCAILRHRIGRLRRSHRREPVRMAEGLEAAEEIPSTDTPAGLHAIDNEEQAMLWHALAGLPEIYREPLVLYYREHRSVEHVASALELSEDAVKQRLARGRRILQEQVLARVEGALERSSPGRLFTFGVLAALPNLTPSVTTSAGLGAAAVKGGWLAKSTPLAPLLSAFSGAISALLTLRANLDQARTPLERRQVARVTVGIFSGALGILLGLGLLGYLAEARPAVKTPLAWASQGLVLVFMAGFPLLILQVMRRMRVLRSAERQRHPHLFRDARDRINSSAAEYRSRRSLLGVPLVHIRFASPDEGQPPVFGWIAGGDRAYGILIAWGGLAVAPLSLGAVSVGLVTVGTVSLGVISIGTAALGVLAIGCMAAGINACGWLSALGWHTAQGSGFSIARIAAQGPVAFAPHANDAFAHQLLANSNHGPAQLLFVLVISLLTLLPIAIYARAVRRRLGPKP